MANIRSSKKDLRRSARKRVQNQAVRTSLKTYIKRVRVAEDATAAQTALAAATKALDKAVQRGVIHKNQAARRKSRAAKAANALKA